MATTVGAAVLSDELVVAQSDKVAIGTEVQTLVIEFDQRKYEEFLSFGASSPVKTRKCRRVSYETSAPVDTVESSRANLENQSPSSKDEAPKTSQQAKKWVVKQPKPTSDVVSQVLASCEPRSACTKAGPSNGPLSRRAKQRQRQNQARRRARALVSLDGFYCRPKKVKQVEGRTDEGHNEPRLRTPDNEPRHHQEVHLKQDERHPWCEPRPSGEPRQHEVRLKQDEPRPRGELRQHEVPPKQGERHSDDEPRPHEPRRQHEVPRKQDERHPDDEPRHRRQTRRQPHQADLRQKGKASARWTGALHQARRTGEPHAAEPRQHTRTQLGVAFPFGYMRSVPTSDGDDGYCSGMATSWTSNSIQGRNVEVHMTDILDEISRRFEEQQATLSEQQATINSMKEMLEQLLSEKKKKKRRASRALHKSSGRKERMPTPHTSSDSLSESSGGASSSGHNPRDERLDELQSQLNALKLQKSMNKLGVVRPYPIEWDTVSYPAKFEPLDLLQFDGKGSPSQHIYYFQAQTGHIVGNDPIMTRLFIGTLKGVAFEWFRRLEPGSITCWKDMERLFMARFFDDDTGVSVATLLAAKQRKTESVSNFVKRFRNRSLRARDQISEATLIEMCRNNLSIDILSNMGAVAAHSWKGLIRQGEQVESMLKRKEVEELFEFRGSDDQDTLEMATNSSSNLFSSQKGFPFTSAELANSEPSYGTDCEDLATISQK